MLALNDLNQIIKFYACHIQRRIEELESSQPYYLEETQGEEENQFIAIVSKYNNYQTLQDQQLKMIDKFRQRILQIFQFFKLKSNNQNLLNLIQTKIDKELQKFTTQIPIKLGQLFSYIHLITKKGCIVRPPTNKRMRLFTKPVSKQGVKANSNCSVFNIKKKESSLVRNSKLMNTSFAIEKLKVSDIISQIWSIMDIDKVYLYKIKQGNEGLIEKEMLRRNQKILGEIKRFSNRRNRIQSDDGKENLILSQVKTNNAFKRWSSKNKRIFAQRAKNNSTKENISVFI